MEATKTLEIEHLKLYYRTNQGIVQAVDDVSLQVARHKTLVVLGESGCGKSSLLRAILRLLPRNVHTYSGRIMLDGTSLMDLDDGRFRREIRWTKISYVPQAAMNAFNPVIKVGEQVAEPLLTHRLASGKKEALAKAMEVFRLVGVPTDFIHRYAFELSGGMRQRVATAMALVTDPKLVVLDEPTSALDVLNQANLMNLLKTIKKELGTTFLLITHDIATSSEVADRVAVMYAGEIVEDAPAKYFFFEPLHPYSRSLMASVPSLREKRPLSFIPGQPPSLYDPPQGCRFAERCPHRFHLCGQAPPTQILSDGRRVKCWLYEGGKKHVPADAPARAGA